MLVATLRRHCHVAGDIAGNIAATQRRHSGNIIHIAGDFIAGYLLRLAPLHDGIITFHCEKAFGLSCHTPRIRL